MRRIDLAPCLVAAFLAMPASGCGDDSETNVGAGGNGSGGGGGTTGGPSSSVAGSTSSSSSTASGSATSTATSSSGSGGAGGDGLGGGGGGSGGGEEPTSTRAGEVRVRHLERYDPDLQIFDVLQANFVEIVPALDCTRIEEGDCYFEHCIADEIAVTYRDAGTISVAGTTPDLEVELNDANVYGYLADAPLFTTGETIDISASGAEVPAFESTLVAPAFATLTSPSLEELVVDRAEDFTLEWDVEGEGGVLRVLMGDLVGNDESFVVQCSFPIEDGAGTIPSTVLAGMPTEEDEVALFIVEADEAIIELDGWSILSAVERTSLATTSETGLAQAEFRFE